MSLNDWIGRRVRVTAQEIMNLVAYYLRRTRGHGDILEGIVTHVGARSDSDVESEVWVQLDGLEGEYVFGPSQLEVLPLDGALHPWERRAPPAEEWRFLRSQLNGRSCKASRSSDLRRK